MDEDCQSKACGGEMMADKKLCPMTFSAVISTIRSPKREDFECKEKKCAWWNSNEKHCAIHMLAHYVSAIWEHRYHTER